MTPAEPSVPAARVALDLIALVALASAVALAAAAVLVAAVLALSGRAVAAEPASGGLLLTYPESRVASEAPLLVSEAFSNAAGVDTRVRVRQAFRNPSDAQADGFYVYLLPEDAVVRRFVIRIGDRIVHASAGTEGIAGDTAIPMALESATDPAMVGQSVAAIGPHEFVAVELDFAVTSVGIARPLTPAGEGRAQGRYGL